MMAQPEQQQFDNPTSGTASTAEESEDSLELQNHAKDRCR
jgi:hypothetical protein